MICSDCRPTDAGVELRPYHSQLEQRIATLEAILANRIEEERDERRWALLQAAATMKGRYGGALEVAVNEAEELLEAIEKREPREATK